MAKKKKKKKAKKRAAPKVAKTGEVDVAALMKRVEAECRAGTFSTRTALDLAVAIQERLPFDLSECTSEFSEECHQQVAEELSDLCCAVAGISADRRALGVL